MSVHRIAAAATAALLASAVAAAAAEIRLICAGGIGPVVTALAPGFEKASGHRLRFKFVSGPVVKREIDKGEAFDVAISLPRLIEELIKSGKIAAGSRADIARTGVGVSVRAGAPKPDIGTVDAFKRTLLSAKAIAHSKEGASGVYFRSLLDRLGIKAQIEPKLIGSPPGAGGLVSPVVKGQAEIVVGTMSAIMEPGVELVGPIPDALQNWVTFTAGVNADSKEAAAAQALIRYLTAPAAYAAIKAKGMQPLGK
ncbi:MAG: substrate-binding domain-containing protein [Xanthobacteraceae bacterium]